MNISQTNTLSKVSFSIEQTVATIRGVMEQFDVPRTLHQPLFQGHEWDYLKDCIDTGWVSSVGSYVDRIEQMLAEYTGAKRAVAVVNGTAALFIALKLAGVVPGDEVLIPTLTFVATANAVAYCGATPHLADSEFETLGMGPAKLEDYLADIAQIDGETTRNRFTGARIKAVIPMHTFGHPVDLDPLVDLCKRWNLEMIEDAAESLGSFYKKQHTGTFGRIGILSFNGNKIVTTGGGGALLFNCNEEAKLAKYITTTARRPHKWEYYHDMLGYNFRMPNVNAALGCAQLENLPSFLERKRKLTLRYVDAFRNVPGVKVVEEPPLAHSNYWLNALVLDEGNASQRNALLESTNAIGIMTRPAWTLMHHLPMYKNCPRMDLSVAENLERRIVNIPSSVPRIGS